MIDHERKMIFIPVPRCGSTAVLKVFGCELRGGHPTWRVYASKEPKAYASYFKWAVVRNPWDRLRSCYNYARMDRSFWHPRIGEHPDKACCDGNTFERIVLGIGDAWALRHEGWRPQYEWWAGGGDIQLVPMEHLSDFVFQRFGFPVPYVNASTQEKHEFTAEMNGVIKRMYRPDIGAYGKAKHEWERAATAHR